MRQTHRRPIVALLVLLTILTLTGCDENSTTIGPTSPSGPLVVQSTSTATQIDGRVQVRVQVITGLGPLTQAALSNVARGQVCYAGTCSERPISTTFAEGMCANVVGMPAGDTTLGVAVAWLDGDRVGIDFCVGDLGGERTFEITVMDGMNRSNIIRTVCAAGRCLS